MNNELIHYGIPGMRWGYRKGKRVPSEDHISSRKIKKKHISEMSNKDLQGVNQRLQLERQYKDLTKRKNIGKKIVTGFVAGAATLVAVEAAVGKYKKSKTVNAVLNKVGDVVIKGIDLTGPLTK